MVAFCLFLLFVWFLWALLCIPFTLKLIAKQMRHEDKIVPADIIFVPRFAEDKNGELYTDAFREYWAGNGKSIYVEEDKIFGISIEDVDRKNGENKRYQGKHCEGYRSPEGEEIAKAK